VTKPHRITPLHQVRLTLRTFDFIHFSGPEFVSNILRYRAFATMISYANFLINIKVGPRGGRSLK